MKYDLTNNTNADITVGPQVVPAGGTVCIFNASTGQYETGLTIIQENSNELGVYVTKGDITFLIDDIDVGADGYYATVNTWNDKLEGNTMPYLQKLGNAYFDLSDNKLKILSILDNTWYSVQLTADAEV